MGFKRWIIKQENEQEAQLLSEVFEIDRAAATVASVRGIADLVTYEDFMFADPYESCRPFEIKDMEKAVKSIYTAVKNKDKITVFGDYDCDGVTATALLYSYLRDITDNVEYYIPDRLTEGYGMNSDAVNTLYENGTKLIVTVDNGIAAVEETELANSLGMKVVITDHHLPQEEMPKAAAIVDPHREDDTSEYENLCGAGIAYMLCFALNIGLRGIREEQEMIRRFATLVTVGTVGDVVPLLGINRRMCQLGTKPGYADIGCGLSELNRLANNGDEITSESIGFKIAPCINAAGRLGDSRRAVELLLCNDKEKAEALARELLAENENRKELCEQIYNEAVEIIESRGLKYNGIIVAEKDDWHFGVIGIVASRICEKYSKPCILLSGSGDSFHGSGRSIRGFSLFDAITFAKEHTVVFGGHELAAGVTVKREQLGAFSEKLYEYASACEPCIPTIEIDCVLGKEYFGRKGIELCREIEGLAPFGAGNHKPLFAIKNAKILQIIPLKFGKFVKLLVEFQKTKISVLCFKYGTVNFLFSVGNYIDIAFDIKPSTFEVGTLDIVAQDIRPTGLDDEKYYSGLFAFDRLSLGNAASDDIELLEPNRDDFKRVYAYLCFEGCANSFDAISAHLHDMGVGKIAVVLKAFMQLGLVNNSGCEYNIVKGAGKTSVENAEIMKELKRIKAGDIK